MLAIIIIRMNIISPILKISSLRLRTIKTHSRFVISSLEVFPLCGNFTGTVAQWLRAQRAENTDVIIATNGGVRLIFRVVYSWMNPLPLVIGIVNDPRFPLSLSKEPKSEHSISVFPFFSCNQKDQSIYKDSCVFT